LFPLRSIHPKAYDKAKVIACSSIPLTLLDHVYEGKNLVTDNVCDTTVIDKNLKLADTLGIKSTPTMVLEDGRMIRGYKDASSIVEFINSAEINKKEAKKEKKDETKKESKKEDSKN
jgi:thiol:disulfide interchange protein DsbC